MYSLISLKAKLLCATLLFFYNLGHANLKYSSNVLRFLCRSKCSKSFVLLEQYLQFHGTSVGNLLTSLKGPVHSDQPALVLCQ